MDKQKNIRKRIYELIHNYDKDIYSKLYKYLMMGFIVLSLVPLVTKNVSEKFVYAEAVCLVVFIADYLLRWLTADYKLGISGITAFLRYPFRLIPLIDLLAVFALLCSVFNWFEGLEITHALSVFRIIRFFRYSKSFYGILDVLRQSQKSLKAVFGLSVGYIFISAIIIFNVESESFKTFFDAIYWATVSLTTVGYGDIYPVTDLGRVVAMVSSFFGIAIVALPAGIVTAEYLNSLKENK